LPDLATYPNTHYWYLFVSTFSPVILKGWADKHAPAAPAKKEEDKDSLFGSDDDEPTPKVAKAKKEPKKEVKKEEPKKEVKKKEKPIAKSIVVFDVKVYEVMNDAELEALAKKILELKIEGLVWNNTPKYLDVAYGVRMIQMGCVIEDDKVLTDDIFDQITAWEDIVQSVDMVSMQKL
jgi:elongation factor 1-beta